jgi:CDP-ribitol ribitolphosphotransferase
MVLTIRILLVRLAFAWARFLPLQRRVVFATAHADELGGNLAILRDELATRHPGVRVVSLAHRPGRGIRGKVAAAWHAVVAAAYLATSRVFVVDDYFFPIYVVTPRRGTTIIQTWHACGASSRSSSTRATSPRCARRAATISTRRAASSPARS